jgi:hypothetical protein
LDYEGSETHHCRQLELSHAITKCAVPAIVASVARFTRPPGRRLREIRDRPTGMIAGLVTAALFC